MKKILLGTSALAIAALAATPAALADSSVDGPKFKVTGSMDYYARFTDEDEVNKSGPGTEFNMHNIASEIVFDFNDVADNGLEYGAQIQWRYGENSIDEAWMEFGGNWGKVYFGDQDGSTDNQIAGASVLAKGLHDTGRFVGGWQFSNDLGTIDDTVGLVGESSDATKIYYQTPSFAGFSASVSYTPDTASTFGSSNGSDGKQSVDITSGAVAIKNGNRFQNVWEGSLDYSNDFNGVGISAHISALHADAEAFNDNISSAGTKLESGTGWQAGVKVDFAGFEVAAGYGDRGEVGCVSTVNDCDNGRFYDLGVAYSFDSLKIGAAYFKSDNMDLDGDNLEDETDAFGIEANYKVAEGLSTYAGVQWVDEDTEGTSAESTVFVLGTAMSF